jgi:hypothetical protein
MEPGARRKAACGEHRLHAVLRAAAASHSAA